MCPLYIITRKSQALFWLFLAKKVLDFLARKSIMEPRHTCAEHTQKKRGILSDTP